MLDGGIHGSDERGTFIPQRRFERSDRFKRYGRSIEMNEIKESIDEPTRRGCDYLVVIVENWPKTVMQEPPRVRPVDSRDLAGCRLAAVYYYRLCNV